MLSTRRQIRHIVINKYYGMNTDHPIRAYVGIAVYLFGFIFLVLSANANSQDSLLISSAAIMAIGLGVALQPER